MSDPCSSLNDFKTSPAVGNGAKFNLYGFKLYLVAIKKNLLRL